MLSRTTNLHLLIRTLIFLLFSFTANAQPNMNGGPGGPILVISSSSNPFTTYPAEMLRAEGWNAFDVADVSTISASLLNDHDVVILGEMSLTADQVSLLTTWTNNGGTLIAFRPDAQLNGLLGINSTGGTMSDRYLYVNQASSPGAGIVAQTIQYHGPANLYTVNSGTTVVATLFSSATTATPSISASNPSSTCASKAPSLPRTTAPRAANI